MNTRITLGSIFASISVLAIGWQLGAAGVSPASITGAVTDTVTGTSGSTGTAGGTSTTTSTSPTASSAPRAPSATTVASTDGVYTGSDVQTRFGSVQVQVTIAGGVITEVTPLQLTDVDGRSVQISNQAAPMLRHEVLAAQSAQVNSIGGATYTSQGYLSSLQSALDQAGL